MRRDSKEFSVYGVVVGKGGVKLQESALDPETEGDGGKGGVNVTAEGGARGTTVRYGRGAYFTLADNKFEARKLSMALLADSIGRFVERPVVDYPRHKLLLNRMANAFIRVLFGLHFNDITNAFKCYRRE